MGSFSLQKCSWALGTENTTGKLGWSGKVMKFRLRAKISCKMSGIFLKSVAHLYSKYFKGASKG